MRENGTLTWLISDHLGSTSATVNAAGVLLSSLKYTAFGELRSGTAATDYLYTGQRQEAEIGLYFYMSRFFDPALGRFISPDSIVPRAGDPQAYDRYSYTNNNPVRFSDPTGHCPLCVTAIIGGAIGAIVGAIGYTAYTSIAGHEFNTGQMLLTAEGVAVAVAVAVNVAVAVGVEVAVVVGVMLGD